MAIYIVSDPSLSAVRFATKKLGFPLSPTVRGPALTTTPDSEEAIEAIGLLPVQGEA